MGTALGIWWGGGRVTGVNRVVADDSIRKAILEQSLETEEGGGRVTIRGKKIPVGDSTALGGTPAMETTVRRPWGLRGVGGGGARV